uniref:Uncharacterized protein n=1 Tax=Anguilla anguilla TaxID=7936 RepID=A0A0E9R6Z0_ANGAN
MAFCDTGLPDAFLGCFSHSQLTHTYCTHMHCVRSWSSGCARYSSVLLSYNGIALPGKICCASRYILILP